MLTYRISNKHIKIDINTFCSLSTVTKGSATGMKSWRLSLKSEILSYWGYSNYLHKFTEITIACLASLAIMCLKS